MRYFRSRTDLLILWPRSGRTRKFAVEGIESPLHREFVARLAVKT